MREIKFRAWDEDNEVMSYSGLSFNDIEDLRQALDSFSDYFSSSYFSDNPEYLMQYTGLKDKNGVEIYEGDILTCEEYPYKDEGVRNYDAVVEWVFNGWQLVLSLVNNKKRGISNGMNQGEIEDLNDFEVIGNIYETKEK